MTITKLHVSATRGANRRPTCGDVFFADGKAYGWFTDPTDDSLWFSSHRRRASGAVEHFIFRSVPRAAALRAHLEG